MYLQDLCIIIKSTHNICFISILLGILTVGFECLGSNYLTIAPDI